jgi:phosphatidylglycerophosphate synthase
MTYNSRDVLSLPGLLSLSRVALALCFPFVVDRPWLALTTIAAAGLSDVLDGYIARRQGGGTPTGAALDPVTDKIFATAVMLSLIASERLPLGWAALLSLRELLELPLLLWLLSIPRARAVRAAHLKANWLGKLTTVLQLGALVAVLFERRHVFAWVVATALAGAVAAALYWVRFIQALSRRPASAIASPRPGAMT